MDTGKPTFIESSPMGKWFVVIAGVVPAIGPIQLLRQDWSSLVCLVWTLIFGLPYMFSFVPFIMRRYLIALFPSYLEVSTALTPWKFKWQEVEDFQIKDTFRSEGGRSPARVQLVTFRLTAEGQQKFQEQHPVAAAIRRFFKTPSAYHVLPWRVNIKAADLISMLKEYKVAAANAGVA